MSIYRLIKSVQEFQQVTSGRHSESPGIDASNMVPNSGKPANKPHVRADTQSEFKYSLQKGEEDLEKGLKGDWAQEGYTVQYVHYPHQSKNSQHTIVAHDKSGNRVGKLHFYERGNDLKSSPGTIVNVDSNHQRKGLASAMYAHAESKFGKKFTEGTTTGAGSKLWSQPNRPFGKSESSSSWSIKIKGITGYHPVKDVIDNGKNGSQYTYLLEDGRQIPHHQVEDLQINTLKKTAEQIKTPKLLPTNQRPEQDVRRIEPSNDPYAPSKSESTAIKQLTPAYGSRSAGRMMDDQSSDPTNAIHDPYESKLSFVSTKAPEDTVAHEAHHRTVTKLVDRYGLDKVHNLYKKMTNMIPDHLLSLLHGALQTNDSYRSMLNSPSKRMNLAYKEELVNLVRDFATDSSKKGRRSQLKDYYAKNGDNVDLKGIENFRKLDHAIKNTWQNITKFANNATHEHMED